MERVGFHLILVVAMTPGPKKLLSDLKVASHEEGLG